MTVSKFINTVGLACDIAGAYLIWKYGLPDDVSRHGRNYLVTEQVMEEEIARGRKYDRMSNIGFILLALGFGLQLISNFVNA
ncbi:MAG: hypothetical protein C0483_14155 [Pirellula sp.]|nr:hypothetical protein [Pirellula sp.]